MSQYLFPKGGGGDLSKVKFAVEEIFSLVDVGIALTGNVSEGVLKPGMELVLPDKNFGKM